MPGVLAVITGRDLEKYNLHWMPTLMCDTQMVLPDRDGDVPGAGGRGGHRHDRYAAADGVAAVDVDYDPLPVVVDPYKALEPGRAGAAHRQEGQERQPHLALGGGRQGRDRAGLRGRRRHGVKQDIYLPRIHVASIETCGCVADFDKATGKLTVYMTTQAPHAIRTVVRARRGPRRALGGADPHHLAGHRRRLRRQGAGLSGLRDRRRRLGADRQAGQVDRGSDGEPPGRLVRARLSHRRRAGGSRRTARSPACASRPSPTTAMPTRPPTRRSSRRACSRICTGSYDIKAAHVAESTACTPTSHPAASRIAARSA